MAEPTEDLIGTALKTATDTKDIVIGTDVLGETGAMFTRLFPGKRAIVVADENTYDVAGEQVEASLSAAGIEQEERFVFPGKPTLYAGYENVEKVREHLRPLDAIAVSIGAGTLNDIVKLASGELERPYMNVCTAASMDGYAAFGASITKDGFKITRNCPAPAGLLADLSIMAAAPKRLTATGYGDLIEKIPAGADWIVSDILGIEEVDDYVWSLVQGPLRDALADPDKIGAGDPEAIRGLAEGNIMSGLAMQAHQSSRPASGAGHQFSHTWEMEGHGLDWEPPLSHGEKVGVGTVASLAIWEALLRADIENLDVDAVVAAWPSREEWLETVRKMNDKPEAANFVDAAVEQSDKKYIDSGALRERLELLKKSWPEIQQRVGAQIVEPGEARDWLAAVGAPKSPADIEVDWERFKETYYRAQTIRSRYTVLDVALEAGLLEELVEGLFQPGGYWYENGYGDRS